MADHQPRQFPPSINTSLLSIIDLFCFASAWKRKW
jgi:hypothetical protein